MAIQVELADGGRMEVSAGTTVEQVAASIGSGLRKRAIAGKIDGAAVDLSRPIERDCRVGIVTADSREGLAIYRHSAAHLMAQAIKRLYGGHAVKLGVGPAIEDGFYYDVDLAKPLSAGDLAAIEAEMRVIAREDLPIVRRVVPREEARRLYESIGDPLKLELLRELPPEAEITLYEQGEFVDLCRGPHVPSTGRLQAFKLTHVAGAYWRGDSNNKMLQRIYGTAFAKASELEEHLRLLEEAKKRDHRKLSRELGLFMFAEEAPGMPFYLPKGMTVRTALENFSREVQGRHGYEEVRTPMLMNNRVWEQSGHWDHYKDNMYFADVDETRFALKPMNCPGHMLVYKNGLRSYRDLPIRLCEFGQVHRHELSGALSGMMRVRTFCQDDAHIFAAPGQIEEEVGRAIALIERMYAVFGFAYRLELSTRPDDRLGSDELWDRAEAALRNVLDARGIAYQVNEGDGAFYGPKIDFHILDALKRSWQCGTVQLDFQMPEKFDLTYVGEDGRKHRPVVIHRAIFGSIDRFMGILTEHYAGAFPLWLAPVQAKVLPVSEAYAPYAREVERELADAGLRVEVDGSGEKLGAMIRTAQLEKVPYMLIVGEHERRTATAAIRHRSEGDRGRQLICELADALLEEIRMKR